MNPLVLLLGGWGLSILFWTTDPSKLTPSSVGAYILFVMAIAAAMEKIYESKH
jgi:hypothetical protein